MVDESKKKDEKSKHATLVASK